MKKTELKVNINCKKCKTEVFKAVAKLEGVDQIKVDAAKGMLTVVGEVDPVCVATQVRKTGKNAEIVSVEPPKKPNPRKPKAPKPHPGTDPRHLPPSCPHCQLVAISYEPYDNRICSIL